ncbi:hypothetical protein PHYPSEUDO_006234 [Phytophthora pseudosyringae]|uniref:Ubiquitin-like protease family profile domain-containing protein n=1 Tax=Phytophthora pseudosyringae TaxID=221518 RepID=A0A8T1VJ69_9STRA|nr:hypothetical protein PHYPSEUDO_006234 [Phytophthora pseudosyringae]
MVDLGTDKFTNCMSSLEEFIAIVKEAVVPVVHRPDMTPVGSGGSNGTTLSQLPVDTRVLLNDPSPDTEARTMGNQDLRDEEQHVLQFKTNGLADGIMREQEELNESCWDSLLSSCEPVEDFQRHTPKEKQAHIYDSVFAQLSDGTIALADQPSGIITQVANKTAPNFGGSVSTTRPNLALFSVNTRLAKGDTTRSWPVQNDGSGVTPSLQIESPETQVSVYHSIPAALKKTTRSSHRGQTQNTVGIVSKKMSPPRFQIQEGIRSNGNSKKKRKQRVFYPQISIAETKRRAERFRLGGNRTVGELEVLLLSEAAHPPPNALELLQTYPVHRLKTVYPTITVVFRKETAVAPARELLQRNIAVACDRELDTFNKAAKSPTDHGGEFEQQCVEIFGAGEFTADDIGIRNRLYNARDSFEKRKATSDWVRAVEEVLPDEVPEDAQLRTNIKELADAVAQIPPTAKMTIYGVPITASDLYDFSGTSWFSDACVDIACISMMSPYYERTEWVSPLMYGIDMESRRQQLAARHLFRNGIDKVVTVVNYNGNHWCAIGFDMDNGTRVLFDPLQQRLGYAFLDKVYKDNFAPLLRGVYADMKEQHCTDVQQVDVHSCGVLIVEFARCFVAGLKMTEMSSEELEFCRYLYLRKAYVAMPNQTSSEADQDCEEVEPDSN